ncbi:MAG: double-cubane-cluster-containing anaerobic reductase [Dethiobacter sp.]
MSKELVKKFMEIRGENVIRLKEMKEKGGKIVGYYCTFFPQELALAAGAVPVGLCGTKEEPIAAAEETLPRNLCALIKSSYGFAVTDKCPFFNFSDLIVGETTCDGKKKMFEFMGEFKPVHVMQLPYMKESKAALDLWVEELRRLRSRLESELDVTISDEAIWQAIDVINRESVAAKALCDLNQQEPPALSGMDLLTVIWSRGFNINKEEIIEMLNELRENLGSGGDVAAGQPRVLITGCPIGLGSEKVVQLVEDVGGTVVALENCTGYKILPLQTDTSFDDPVVALAHKYLQIPCSCMTPNTGRIKLLTSMAADFKADVIIDLTWQACHTYNMESREIAKLAKRIGLPFLQLETDYSASDMENLKVRIEAILEMVEK